MKISDFYTAQHRKQTGVYAIVNIVNGKMYIGSAAQSFSARWSIHLCDLLKNKHHSRQLSRAAQKYTLNKLKFVIVETCSPERCVEREQHYIDTLKPEYNTCKVAGSTLGVKPAKELIEKSKQTKCHYIYTIQTPNSEIVEVSSLNTFCKERNLLHHILRDTLRGHDAGGNSVSNHKGYVLLHKRLKSAPPPTDIKLQNLVIKGTKEWSAKQSRAVASNLYKIELPDGNTVQTHSLRAFAREHSLAFSSIDDTFKNGIAIGRTMYHKGYRILSKTPLKK